MSEKGLWNQDWIEIQQKYWENLSEMGRNAMGLKASSKSPWESAMDHWWQTISPAASNPAQEFMEKMLGQGKVFFRMAEQFSNSLQGSAPTANWSESLNKVFSDLQAAFTGDAKGLGTDSLHKMMAFWEMPLDNWQRMVSSLSLMPGDMLRNMPHGADFERFLSAPGLGYTREEQSQQQEMVRVMMDYQRGLQDYTDWTRSFSTTRLELRRDLCHREPTGRALRPSSSPCHHWTSSTGLRMPYDQSNLGSGSELASSRPASEDRGGDYRPLD